MLRITRGHRHNRFTALFPGPARWAGARREPLDFMVQGKINRCRHTDHPAGRHTIQTNQCPSPPSPIFYKQCLNGENYPVMLRHEMANDCIENNWSWCIWNLQTAGCRWRLCSAGQLRLSCQTGKNQPTPAACWSAEHRMPSIPGRCPHRLQRKFNITNISI